MPPMPLSNRAEFEALLADYAKADAQVKAAVGRRHDALHACVTWAQKYSEQKAQNYTEVVGAGGGGGPQCSSAGSGGNGATGGDATLYVTGAKLLPESLRGEELPHPLGATSGETDLRSAGTDAFAGLAPQSPPFTPKRYERVHTKSCRMDTDHFGNCAP